MLDKLNTNVLQHMGEVEKELARYKALVTLEKLDAIEKGMFEDGMESAKDGLKVSENPTTPFLKGYLDVKTQDVQEQVEEFFDALKLLEKLSEDEFNKFLKLFLDLIDHNLDSRISVIIVKHLAQRVNAHEPSNPSVVVTTFEK